MKRNSKYVISKSGIVYLKNRKIKQRINHKHIEILIDKKTTYIHILLYENFIGEIPKGYVIHHKDFNPLNNNLDNLICISRGDHVALHNKTTRKSMYGKRKRDLTIEQKEKIIKLSLQGLSNRKVASIVGCGKTIVQKLYKNYLESESDNNE